MFLKVGDLEGPVPTYNLWSLFARLTGLNPGHHTQAIKSRRNFYLWPRKWSKVERWQVLKGQHERLRMWLVTTASARPSNHG